jgi:hypothetical protein
MTLAEQRARVADLAAEITKTGWPGEDHVEICTHQPRCRGHRTVSAELWLARRELARWFSPDDHQGVLW